MSVTVTGARAVSNNAARRARRAREFSDELGVVADRLGKRCRRCLDGLGGAPGLFDHVLDPCGEVALDGWRAHLPDLEADLAPETLGMHEGEDRGDHGRASSHRGS
jgi:hypothetical protein